MPIECRDADRLADLATLQGLRTMRDEQVLSSANAKLSRSKIVRAKRQKSLAQARLVAANLIASPEFMMDELQLLQAIAQAQEAETERSESAVSEDRALERRARMSWHASRFQEEVLRREVRTAEKYLSRKKHERAESDQRDRRSNCRKDVEV